ncbi:MAG: FliA/WhiG family RNA polymerase sigma factor, partial [Myxococcota bacterium]
RKEESLSGLTRPLLQTQQGALATECQQNQSSNVVLDEKSIQGEVESSEPLVEHQRKLERNRAVLRYLPLIKRVSARLSCRFLPLMEEEDMISVGVVGLIDALERYQPGALAFSQYAEIRIRGAILDELRRSDVLSRAGRRKAKVYRQMSHALRNRLGREPRVEEIAKEYGCSLQEVEDMRARSVPVVFLEAESVDIHQERVGGGAYAIRNQQNPQKNVQRHQIKSKVFEALEQLPEREKLVLYLYYFEEMTLREIGDLMDLSESRICQLHQKACVDIRAHLPFDIQILCDE